METLIEASVVQWFAGGIGLGMFTWVLAYGLYRAWDGFWNILS